MFGLYRQEPKQIKKGHLALPTSQQTSPLFSFGQNIVDKYDKQLYSYLNAPLGENNRFVQWVFEPLYGITNNLSLLIGVPLALDYRIDGFKSSGINDLVFQLEGALVNYDTIEQTTMVTLVANITAPTGDAFTIPPLGYANPTFFIGSTASYMSNRWYFFTCLGARLPTKRGNTRFGNNYLYQCGAAASLLSKENHYIFAAEVELFGSYSERNTIRGCIDPNYGGNVVYLGPSLWFSTQHLMLQAGVAYPIAQHLLGAQGNNSWYPLVSMSYKF